MTHRLSFLAGCLLLTAAPLFADEAEDKAVEAVKKLGGSVTRDDKAEGKPVVVVDLSGTQVTDAGMQELAPLKGLKKLVLGSAKVTDAGLKKLAALKGLQTLDLTGTKVTDEGLKELAPLKGLEELVLNNTQVTGAGLRELAPLTGLHTLFLTYCEGVTDAGLKDLAGLKGLKELILLNSTEVTAAGVAELKKALPDCKIYR